MPRPKTTETLAENLALMMSLRDISAKELAKKSGVSDRMINFILSQQRRATVDVAEKLAEALGITGWQLIMPGLKEDLIKNGKLQKLVDNYKATTESGREYICHVSEREAEYNKKTK